MKNLEYLSREEAQSVRFLLTDVDDTITSNGRLRPKALNALYQLEEAGIRTICVTGGSAGWADTYIRQWPIEAVISESGAVSLYRESKAIKQFVHPSINKEGYADRVKEMVRYVLSTEKGAKLSSDQFARIYDVAFDHGSEPPYLEKEGIQRVVALCHEMGASTAVSSIHINAWFGHFDKYLGTKAFFTEILGIDEKEMLAVSCYCGDAPNDQVMFSRFPLSFGVGNIVKHQKTMSSLPSYYAQTEGGDGFAEIIKALLEKR